MEMTLLLLSGVSIVCAPPPLVFIIRVMKVITVVVFLTKLPDTLLTVSNNGYGYRERCALLGAMLWPCNPYQNHHCNTVESHTHTHTHTHTQTHAHTHRTQLSILWAVRTVAEFTFRLCSCSYVYLRAIEAVSSGHESEMMAMHFIVSNSFPTCTSLYYTRTSLVSWWKGWRVWWWLHLQTLVCPVPSAERQANLTEVGTGQRVSSKECQPRLLHLPLVTL